MIIALIARNTFREAVRDRVLVAVVGSGVALLALTQVLSPLALGEGRRLTVDLGLSAISILGMVVIMTVGTSLVSKEIERRTIYSLLSRPINRPSYLIGKWAGLTACLWGVSFALGVALWGTLALRGEAGRGAVMLEAVYLAGLELSAMTSLAVLFSALSTPVLSALYTLGCYCLGQWSYDLRQFAHEFPPSVAGVINVAANVVPNLPIFNMRSLAAEGLTTTGHHLGIATIYAVVFCGCILSLAAVAFENRDFK